MRSSVRKLCTLPAIVALISTACGPAPEAGLQVGEVRVDDPAALAALAAGSLLAELDGYDVAVVPSPDCFFSVGEEGMAESRMFCGPVSVLDGSGPWAVLGLDLSGPVPAVSGVGEVGVGGPRGRALLSASGVPAPSETFLPPPPLAPGRVLFLPGPPTSLLTTSRSGWELRAPVSQSEVAPVVRVLSTTEVASFGSGYGLVSAPAGYRLAVVELETHPGVGASDLSLYGAPLARLSRVLVFAAPDRESLPPLTLSLAGSVQSLSLSDGTVSGDFRPIWYGSPGFRTTQDGPLVVTVGLPPVAIPGDTVPRVYPADVSVGFEVLPPSLYGPYGRVAPAGRVWLPVRLQRAALTVGTQFVQASLLFAGSYAAGDMEGQLELGVSGPDASLYALVPEDLPDVLLAADVFVAWETRTFADTGSGIEPAGSVRIAVTFG